MLSELPVAVLGAFIHSGLPLAVLALRTFAPSVLRARSWELVSLGVFVVATWIFHLNVLAQWVPQGLTQGLMAMAFLISFVGFVRIVVRSWRASVVLYGEHLWTLTTRALDHSRAPVAIIMVDRTGRVVACAGTALALSGHPPAAIMGRAIAKILPDVDLVNAWERALLGEEVTMTHEAANGELLHTEWEPVDLEAPPGAPAVAAVAWTVAPAQLHPARLVPQPPAVTPEDQAKAAAFYAEMRRRMKDGP